MVLADRRKKKKITLFLVNTKWDSVPIKKEQWLVKRKNTD
jgi:hypothetical protein